MTHMLDRVLLLGKAEAHMLEFKPAQIDLKALCQDLLAEAIAQRGDSSCQLLLQISPEPVVGWYDEKLLRHTFGNLLSNAVKFTEAGSITLAASRQGDELLFRRAHIASRTLERSEQMLDRLVNLSPDPIA